MFNLFIIKDTNAHVTANTVLSLASRAGDIFESSEVDETAIVEFRISELGIEREKALSNLT